MKENDRTGRYVETEEFVIKIAPIENSKDHTWFSVESLDGGTSRKPYGVMSLAELIQLQTAIDYTIMELKELE